MRRLMGPLWLGSMLMLAACGDESASTTDATTTSTATGSGGATATSTASSTAATGGAGGGGGPSGSGGSGGGLTGDPPEPVTYQANDPTAFELLPDDATFTNFGAEATRLQVIPLRDENFPDNVDYCNVGSDTQLNNLQQYARARLIPALQTWVYDVTIESVAEEDGESTYQLVVDGTVVADFTNPTTNQSFMNVTHTWTDVSIQAGQAVEIRAKAHSNLSLTEGAGCRTWNDTYAWARGRWVSLKLEAAAP